MMITKLLCASLVLLSLDAVYGMRRVCYYTNWAQYRPDGGKYTPPDMDPELCTHIVFAFAKLERNKLKAYEWNDESTKWQKGMYAKFNDIKLKNPKIKTLLAVGGWNMGSRTFTALVKTNELITKFAKSTVQFLRERNFDGLDLDWEYPTKRGSPPQDKQRYQLLVQALRQEFDREVRKTRKRPLLLTSAVAAGKENVDDGYDIIPIARDMDFISVMTYDLHGAWENKTGHNSPLFPRAGEVGDDRFLNMNWSMAYWHSKGVPKSKLNVGLALYGRTFTLTDQNQNFVGAPAKGKGHAGKYTREAGFLSYYEICKLIKNNARKVYIDDQKVPYLVNGDQWIGYDDPDSLIMKVNHFKTAGYGGVMMWSLDLDDFKGSCGGVKYPLLKTIYEAVTQRKPSNLEIPSKQIKGKISLPDVVGPVGASDQEFICSPYDTGFFESPYSCDRYYKCINGHSHRFTCPTGLHYNTLSQTCDWPRMVNCDQKAKSALRKKATKAPPTTPAPVTESAPTQMWLLNPSHAQQQNDLSQMQPQPINPSSWQQPIPTQPQATDLFQMNPVNQFMEPPATQRPTRPPMNALNNIQGHWGWALFGQNPASNYYDMVNSQNQRNNFCTNRESGIYPSPQKCNAFIQCAAGNVFETTCGDGTVFNVKHKICAGTSGGNEACKV